jgi:hypothetical protein
MSYAIARILGSEGDETTYGTAFAIAPDRGLTAFHCVGDRETGEVALRSMLLVFPEGARIPATMVDGDPRSDFALLQFSAPLPDQLQIIPLAIDSHPHEPFRCIGHLNLEGTDHPASHGKIIAPDGRIFGVPAIQLFSEEGAAELSLHGMSGAPVLIGMREAAVGIVRWNPPREPGSELAAGGMVFACPIKSVINRRPELNRCIVATHSVLEDIREKTDALFDSSKAASQDQQKKDYEKHYLEQVAIKSGRLDTLGVRDLREFRQHLTISYVSLFVKASKIGGDATRRKAEEVLLSAPLLAIRAPAGAGKTTLLNWIALSCAQGASTDTNNRWNGGVPFFIPLRALREDEQGVPDVGRLVDYAVDLKKWPNPPPPGWITDVLNAGRGVVMLDGVDELPSKFREKFWTWVKEDLLERYPGNRIVITSRYLPEKGTNDWQPPNGFAFADLDEMTDDDVVQFVRQWHDGGMEGETDAEIRTNLTKARESLPQKLFDPVNRRVRDLCGTPLLAAMVCALHWREEGYLPAQRIELYERCVSMLIEERDRKRRIEEPPEPLCWMRKDDKEAVLQRLAFTMMKNVVTGSDEGQPRIEISKAQAEHWIADWIPIFSDGRARNCKAAEVLDHLLERTGLLREPAMGTIEYTHRTFQEYLAACASGAMDVAGELANLALDDQWHETIVLAAGTRAGGVPFGKRLIEELLKRAEKRWFRFGKANEVRQTCFALAVACLETAKQPEQELRGRVLSHLEEIVPPRNAAAAKGLAAAGEAVLPLLKYNVWKDQDEETVAACARAVRLIDGSVAAQTLEDYASDAREAVLVEAARGTINVLDFPLVQANLAEGKAIPSSLRSFITDLTPLRGSTNLTKLDLSGCTGLQDPTPLRGLTNLTSLDLSKCAGLQDLTPLRGLTNLTSLDLSGCTGLRDLTPLSGLANLTSLDLSWCEGLTDLTPLAALTNLDTLNLFSCEGLRDLTPLRGLTNLNTLNFNWCPGITDLTPLRGLTNLTSLDLVGSRGVTDLTPLSGLTNLNSLNMIGCTNLTDLTPLSGLTNLNYIGLAVCDGVRDLTPLVGLSKLDRIWVDKRLADLAPVDLKGRLSMTDGFVPSRVRKVFSRLGNAAREMLS